GWRNVVHVHSPLEMCPESRCLAVMPFHEEQLAVLVWVLLEKQGVLLEEPVTFVQRLSLSVATLRGVKHLYVGRIWYRAKLLQAPAKIGVLAEMRPVESDVEAIQLLERFVAHHQVGRHETDSLEADIGDRPPSGIVKVIRANQAFDADIRTVVKPAPRIHQPAGHRLTVVVSEGNDVPGGQMTTEIARGNSSLHFAVHVMQGKAPLRIRVRPAFVGLVDHDDLEVAFFLGLQALHKPIEQWMSFIGGNDDRETRP